MSIYGKKAWKRMAKYGALLAAVVAIALVVEHVRGKRMLAEALREMERRGEASDIRQMIPELTASDRSFWERFNHTNLGALRPYLAGGGSRIDLAPGRAAQGSRSPVPVGPSITPIYTNGVARIEAGPSQPWAAFGQRIDTDRPALASLRELLHHPPLAGNTDHLRMIHGEASPKYAGSRMKALALNDGMIWALHSGDLDAATDNLIALSALAKSSRLDAPLVPQMIRVAIEGIGTAGLWDVVQSDGWTEPQLRRLQEAWQYAPHLPEVVRSLHAERLARLEYYAQFKRLSYAGWENQHGVYLANLGVRPDRVPKVVSLWRNLVSHPLWKFAWADQEAAHYLTRTDYSSVLLAKALHRRNFTGVDFQLARQSDEHEPPAASWRFYLHLPVVDKLSSIIVIPGGTAPGTSSGPSTGQVDPLVDFLIDQWKDKRNFVIPTYGKAVATAVRIENTRNMSVTALALKRHWLRHGRFPEGLEVLVPEFLPSLPLDWWNGETLHYRLHADGTYLLYSVGMDGKDDGGDSTPVGTERWNPQARDQLWPRPVPWEK